LAHAIRRRYPLITNELLPYLQLTTQPTYADTADAISKRTKNRWGFDVDHAAEGVEDDLSFLAKYNKVLSDALSDEHSYFEDKDDVQRTELVSKLDVYEHSHRYVGDKAPIYATAVADIAARFPEIKVIYIQRDGREVAGSLLRLKWKRTTRSAFKHWLHYVNTWHGAKQYVNHIEIENAELLSNPAAVAEKVNKFLDDDIPEEYFNDVIVKLGADGLRETSVGYWSRFFKQEAIPEDALSRLQQLGYC